MNFINLLKKSKEDSNSKICVGLDLAVYGSRENNTLDKNQDKKSKLLSLISNLSEYCCVFKVNRQYILDLTSDEIKQVTAKAHEFNRPIIIDHKLSDIGSTNQQALFHIKKEGFDALTASPFPGNVQEVCSDGHKYDLAVIILALMSNPDAIWMKNGVIENKPIFQHLCYLSNKYADGIVVGSTGHVTENDLSVIKEEVTNKVILSPGIGAQGGKLELVLRYFKNDVIFNVSRGVIYNKSPLDALKAYNTQIQNILGN